jgi:predicted metalloprotease with PDZ domain
VDTKIRQLTHGNRSLDDFCKAFYGMDNGKVAVYTYTFDNIVQALNRIAPFDWTAFLKDRLDRTGHGAPLEGITRGGWRLVYTDQPTQYQKDYDKLHKVVDVMDSVGLLLDKHGKVLDALWNGPAFKAGITPGMKLVAVNGRKFDFGEAERLTDAISAAAKDPRQGIALLMEGEDFYVGYTINYHGGNRYPHLVRDEGNPDRLSRIIEPRTR